MQVALHLSGEQVMQLAMPSPETTALKELPWGRHDELGSPAYWAAQAWMWELDEPDHFRLGSTLGEELLACMLGGYGIPAEVGLAAYARLRPHLSGPQIQDEEFVRTELLRPLQLKGRSIRYRFANQKARYISATFSLLEPAWSDLADRELRDCLATLPGVGLKTASWVVRNLNASDSVAILDVHLVRVGRMLGIFDPSLTVERNYLDLEEDFLQFAEAIGARASILDSVMWMVMRRLPRRVLGGMLGVDRVAEVARAPAAPAGLVSLTH